MKKVLLIVVVTVLALASAGGVVYAAAGQGLPPSDSSIEEPSPADASQSGTSPSADSDVPPPDPLSPRASSIPGCVCHSDDPKLVAEHAEYRMNQCFGCHGSTPTGQ